MRHTCLEGGFRGTGRGRSRRGSRVREGIRRRVVGWSGIVRARTLAAHVVVSLVVFGSGVASAAPLSFLNYGNPPLGSPPVQSVYAIGNNIYAATTDGVSISTNGGTSWTNTLAGQTVYSVYAVGSNVYAGSDSFLNVSTDGGSTWNQPLTDFVQGVYADGSNVYAAVPGVGLYVSSDGGLNFPTLRTTANGLGSSLLVGVYAVGGNVYVATFGGVSVSTNGGSSFTNSTTGLGSTTVSGVYALGSTVYAATTGGMGISTDNGSTFTNYTTGLGNNAVNGVFATASTVYAATNGGLGISTDGGITYTNYTTDSGTNPSGLGDNTVYGVYAAGRTIYAATDGGLGIAVAPLIWNTTDGTWNTTNNVWTADTGGSYAFSNGDAVVFEGSGGGVVTLAGDLQPSSVLVSATSGTYTFVSSGGNLISGTAGLAKSGGGTLILSGSNAFTGSTSVTGGKLLVNGVLSSATTTVATALLGGTGTASGAVRLAAGGTIAPGDAGGGTGVLTLGSLSGTGYTIAMGITGTGAGQYDQIVTTGSLNYSGGTLQLSMTGTYANGTSWDLFEFATQSGTLAGVSPMIADSSYNGLVWGLATSSTSVFDQRYGAGIWLSDWSSGGQRFIFNQSNGVLTVVPEPSSFVLAGAGIAGVVLLRRRARRKTPAPPAAVG